MTTPRWVQTPCQPIGIGDLLAYLIAALARAALGRAGDEKSAVARSSPMVI